MSGLSGVWGEAAKDLFHRQRSWSGNPIFGEHRKTAARSSCHAGAMFHGVVSRAELELQGLDGNGIAELVSAGELRHLSHGWYAWRGAEESVAIAASSHTRLGCLSAAKLHGLWIPPEPGPTLHVVANHWESASKIKQAVSGLGNSRTVAQVHRAAGDKRQLVVAAEDAVEQVARFHDSETALVVMESALNLGMMTMSGIQMMLERIPESRARKLGCAAFGSQSGSETRVAHFMRKRGVKVVQQFSPIAGRFADMLIGESWILECDSVAHHMGRVEFENDRHRDLLFRSLGYEVTRLSYQQIWYDWENTQKHLIAILKQRRYLRRPSPSSIRTL